MSAPENPGVAVVRSGSTARRPFTGQAGLQAERTALAWNRTTLGLLTNGALLCLREARGQDAAPELVLGCAALLIAAAVTVLSRRRVRLLASRGQPIGLAPRREVVLIGWSVVALCAGAVVVLALPGLPRF